MGEIDSYDLPFADWSLAHEVGVVMIVSLETLLLGFGVVALHHLSVAR
ncbi:MAG: hypothetical protein ACR2NR_06345 [Solirubrobacteraceae bacterium]